MRLSFVALLMIASAGFAGCGTFVDTVPLDDRAPARPARVSRGVQVFASGPPDRPYREVAVFEVVQTHGLNQQGIGVMIDRLREEGGARGCDGVVLGSSREVPTDRREPLLFPGHTTMQATCIVFPRRRSRPTVAALTASDDDGEPAPGQRVDYDEPR